MTEELEQQVSFPNSDEFEDLPSDPFAIESKTDTGDVIRPAVVIAMLNRGMVRRLNRLLKAKARSQGLPEPVITRARLSERETNERMAEMVIDEWEKYHRYFPLATLQQYLDERTGRIMEQAIREGKPLDRVAVRQALANLHEEAERKRKATA